MDLGLHDRVAIVTGASKGIGRQVAADLGGEGCHVVLCGRDDTALREGAAGVVQAARARSPSPSTSRYTTPPIRSCSARSTSTAASTSS